VADRTRGAPWRLAGGLALAGALVLLVAYPLGELFLAAGGEGRRAAFEGLTGARSVRAVGNTLWTSAVVTALVLCGATAAALVTERTAAPGRRWLRLGMLVPLLVPAYVSALSWARAYGPAGLTERLLGVAVPGVFGSAGVVAVIAVNALPLAYVIIAAGLASRAEPDLERAARAAGASGRTVLRTITLPLLRPAPAAAGALVFVTSANSFGVPAVLGRPAGFATVTTRIYEDLVLSADVVAFTRVLLLASLLVALAVVVVAVTDALVGLRLQAARTGAPAGGPAAAAPPRPWMAGALWAYLLLAVGLPLVALVLVALTRAVGLAPVPANWTLAHFGTVLDPLVLRGVGNSLRLALGAAAAVTILGGLAAAWRRHRAGRLVGSASILTFAVPGSALGVAVLLAYGRWLRDTLLLIGIAYVAKLWALGHRTIAAAVDGLPPDLVRAARASGAGPVTATRTVTVPLLRPAIGAAAAVAFLFAFHELTMSSLLYGPGTRTLAVVILNLHQLGDVQATSALAVLLTLAVLAAAAPLALLRRRAWSWPQE
jgi:iron(III) transport system permease protein